MFWHWDMLLTGLDWKYFNWQQMEFFGNLNLLKTGLVFADRMNTVSPRYAEEIQSAPLGCGLEGVLQTAPRRALGHHQRRRLHEWNPATDPHLAGQVRRRRRRAKAKPRARPRCKPSWACRATPDVPLVAFVGRLVDQKGIDLIAAVHARLGADRTTCNGSSSARATPTYHELLHARSPNDIRKRWPCGWSSPNALAHRIEAGADIFLMPSRYEPCGLNQLYSLKYGTVPVVRATGGLADTIVDTTDETLAAGTATGFSFREYSGLRFQKRCLAPATCLPTSQSGISCWPMACGKIGLGGKCAAIRQTLSATGGAKQSAPMQRV